MKNRHYLRHILAITALLFNGEAIYSQTYPIENYLKAAGDYVTIYNGEIELTYSLPNTTIFPIFKVMNLPQERLSSKETDTRDWIFIWIYTKTNFVH